MTIGVFTLILFFSRLFTYTFDFGNVFFHWWYDLVNFILLIPIFVAFVFICMFWHNDTKENRRLLWIGTLLVISAVLCIAIWAVIYITTCYNYKYVYLGSGPDEKEELRGSQDWSNYQDEEIGGFIFAELMWAILESLLWLYFFFRTKRFEAMYYKEDSEELLEEEKKKKKEKEDKKKKEDEKK